MKKKMTQAQAWLWMARKWDRPVRSKHKSCVGEWYVRINAGYGLNDKGESFGLCGLMTTLPLSRKQFWSMKKKIEAGRPLCIDLFKWGFDRKAARQRAAFCRKQARLLRRK